MIKSFKQRGFTIVETMIVLAIVGAIMLVVFLAVPALQRNSRNTGIKSDVQNVIGAISEFVNNNNGKMPTTITTPATLDGTVTVSGAAGTTSASVSIRGSTTVSRSTVASTTVTTTDQITVVQGFKCNGNVVGNASSRAFAVLYMIEGSSSNTQQCQET